MKRFLWLVLLVTGPAFAAQPSTWSIGPHLLISLPQSEFANITSKVGEGLGGKFMYRVPGAEALNVRADVSYFSYGESRNMTGNVGLMTTRYESFQLTAGPQFEFSLGRVTPYMAPMAGLYIYRTVVSLPEYAYYTGIPASETTESETKLGWNVNGGLLIDIGLGPQIDIGVKYQRIPGAVENTVDTEDGEEIVVSEGDAEDIVITIGVVFFLDD
jgi:hypothetical protein